MWDVVCVFACSLPSQVILSFLSVFRPLAGRTCDSRVKHARFGKWWVKTQHRRVLTWKSKQGCRIWAARMHLLCTRWSPRRHYSNRIKVLRASASAFWVIQMRGPVRLSWVIHHFSPKVMEKWRQTRNFSNQPLTKYIHAESQVCFFFGFFFIICQLKG